MKKNIIMLAAGLSLSSVFFACEKQLELDPRQSISADAALETAEDVQNALIGGYSIAAGGALYGTNLLLLPDLIAGDNYLDWLGTFTSYRDVRNRTMISTNAEANRTWTAAYRVINASNTVLGALSKITVAADKDRTEGEALFLRAAMHFELVKLFGQPYVASGANTQLGVPILTTAITSTEDLHINKPRNTVAEVYAQVEADLNAAIAKLPTTNGTRADRFSAMGLLARVYLQEGKFAQARDMANTVITTGGFTLTTSLEAPFRTDNSSESIFEIQQDQQNNAGTANDGLATFYASLPNNVGRADARVNTTFAGTFDPADKRRTEMIYTSVGGVRPGLYSKKWTDFYGNIPIIRITEMYLIRAEANFRLATLVGDLPLNDINRFRTRAGVAPYLVLTLNDILTERDKELMYEGFRANDYKRTQRNIGALAYNDNKLIFPIPLREINANPGLNGQQNPGY